MRKFVGNVLGLCFVGAIGAIFLFIAYALFVIVPMELYTDAKCLEAGYPRYRVSIGLARYCMTLDGAVTVRVERLK